MKKEWRERQDSEGKPVKIEPRHKEEMQWMERLYHSRTKSAYGKIAGVFERVFRVDKKANRLELAEGADDETIESVDFEINNFNGSNLIHYLETNYLYQNATDPNAWLLLESELLEGVERVKPIIIPSKDVLDYSYTLGVLQYLAVMSAIKKDSGEQAEEFYIYTPGKRYQCIKKEDTPKSIQDKENSVLVSVAPNVSYYVVVDETTPTDKILACRWGYLFNPDTKGETFAYFWDNAKLMMKDLIDGKAQLDMSRALHVFLQKFQYGDKCTYFDGASKCNGGYMTGQEGKMCPSCKGTGLKVHMGADDVIILAMPEEGEKLMIKPSDLASYITLPMDIVEHQAKNVETLPHKMSEAVFGVDVDRASNGSGDRTATEDNNSYELVYDKLNPFATGIVNMFVFIANGIAEMKGVSPDLFNPVLAYPNEFRLETEGELTSQLQRAKEANAPHYIIENIEARLAHKQNRGNTKAVDFMLSIQQFKPFKHLSADQVESKLSTLSENHPDRVAWEYLDKISREIWNRDNNYNLFPYERQKQIFEEELNKEVERITQLMEQSRSEFREEMEVVIQEESEEDEL